jgi:deoxyribonuclease V
MLLAIDTHYKPNQAKTVGLVFDSWTASQPTHIYTALRPEAADYVAGEFYKRELPCIVDLLQQLDLQVIKTIIIDGFVYVNNQQDFGLGGHLYQYLEGKIPVIGVAKTNFMSLTAQKIAVYRGQSKKPLFVTAIGIATELAAQHIEQMNGEFRLPTLLKYLDTLTKEA